jgi:hypothetical protein
LPTFFFLPPAKSTFGNKRFRSSVPFERSGNRSIKKELSILEKFGKELKALEVK